MPDRKLRTFKGAVKSVFLRSDIFCCRPRHYFCVDASLLFNLAVYCSCNTSFTMTEPFPPLSDTLGKTSTNPSDNIRVRRRQSSGLGGDIRGDVDVPSFATARKGTPPLNSPTSFDMSVCSHRAPPRTSAPRPNKPHRSQKRQAAVRNAAPSAARSPNSAANAYGTHGSAR
jgi:hypothetical protein